MKQLIFLLMLLSASVMHTIADTGYSRQWQQANSFYQQKQYDSAMLYYEQITATKPHNAEIYYNLGNTYYRLNKISLAILNYERALNIDPEYKNAKDNLLLAQSRINNYIYPLGDIFFVRWWKAITRPQNASALAVTALVIFLIYISLLFLKRLKGVSTPMQLQASLLLLCCCFLILAFCATRTASEKSAAVTMAADAPLMSKSLKGKPLMLLPEGTIVSIRREEGDWLEVTLPDGREGLVRQDAVSRI